VNEHTQSGEQRSAVGRGSTRAVTSEGLRRAGGRIGPAALFVVLPLALAIVKLDDLHGRLHEVGLDFRGTLWEPARTVLEGRSPYPLPTVEEIVVHNPSVYPPLPILAAIPLALLGWNVALTLWLFVLVASVFLSLRVVGVSDWRCHTLALLSPPVVHGLYLGNVTLLLLLPLALAWRWRSHAVKAGIAVATGVAIKPLLVPLIAWLLLTRRHLAALLSVAVALVVTVASWAAIGFDGMRDYPDLLRLLERAYGPGTDSLPAALSWLVTGERGRLAVCLAAALVLTAMAVALRRRPNGDLAVFASMIGVSVAASPMVWPHYLAFFLVPLGIACPRVSWPWFLGYALWPVLAIDDRVLRATTFLALTLALMAVPLFSRSRIRVPAAS
jgi:alpha-1,2-mannosyltransferase